MIPLFIDCSGRRVVIFGGGTVAARKAAYFAPEARVQVISRSFGPEIGALGLEMVEADVSDLPASRLAKLIGDAFLVITALSDPAQNNRIVKICRKKKIPCNNADGIPGDIILPAVSRGGNYTLAISTGGGSPATSRFVREFLEAELPGLDAMILLQNRLREELKSSGCDPVRRRAILRRVLEDKSVWRRLRSDPELAWASVSERFLHG